MAAVAAYAVAVSDGVRDVLRAARSTPSGRKGGTSAAPMRCDP